MRAVALLALLHAYVGARLLAPLPPVGAAAGASALLALFALLLVAMPASHRRRPGLLGWSGLLAVGFGSSLLVFTVLRDVGLLLAAAFAVDAAAWLAGSALAVPAVAAIATAVGFVHARLPRVRDVRVPLDALPAALDGFTIVQISDLHVGLTIGRRFVQRVVDSANRLAPDLTVLTGDSVDGRVAELRERVAPLGELRARHGVYAVTGNHEYYSGCAPAWVDEFRRLGMTVLMNEHRVLEHDGSPLVLAGVTDYTAHRFEPGHRSDPVRAIDGAPAGAPKLLLAHQPKSAAAAQAAGFDLQLSGHTHGGQFFPWNLLVRFWQPFTAGLHRVGRLRVYISRGTGYWGPPKRLGAPPEITRLRLVAAG